MKVFYIPTGPKNLAALFPAIPFENVAEYYVTGSGFQTPVYKMRCGDNCEHIRLRFLNYLGTVDGMNFKHIQEDHESKSELITRPQSYPLVRQEHVTSRNSIRANNILTLQSVQYNEEQRHWIDELLDSPLTWMEDGDDYIPVKVEDQTTTTLKLEDRYAYELILKVRLSSERFTIRN